RISSILLSSLCTLRPIRSTRTNKSRIAAFSHDGCQSFRMSTHRRFLASAARRMLAYTPGRLLRIFAVSDFSGLTSSACALASAEASAATDSLDRGMGRLRFQQIKTHRPRFRALGFHPVPYRLLGILGHQGFELALRPFVVEKGGPGVSEECGE